MPALVCFGFLNQADVNSVCFRWVCSSRLGQMLLSFVFETTESGPSLPFICESCTWSRELCLLRAWTGVCWDVFDMRTECSTA